MSHVDPEAVDSTVEPESEDVIEFLNDVRVAPVQVGLLGKEQMQVVLPARFVECPGLAAEVANPVVRQRAVFGRIDPYVVVAVLAIRIYERRLKPLVLVARMIRHDVDQHLDTESMCLLDDRIKVIKRSIGWIDRFVVGDVVTPVAHWRQVERCDPQDVDAEPRQMVKFVEHPNEVANAIGVTVGKRADVRLVAHRVTPPLFCTHDAHLPLIAAMRDVAVT